MKNKLCFKCKTIRPLEAFYKHKQMADGHLNKCKDCAKRDVKNHRLANIERIRKYDRDRGNRQSRSYHVEYRNKYPNKYRAQTMTANAVRDEKLFREPCGICGTTERVHAHHDDYLKPLNVRWLCAAHHRQWHIENGEGKNG